MNIKTITITILFLIECFVVNAKGVKSCFAGKAGYDWMIAVVNETDICQMGVVVKNLQYLNRAKLLEYGDDEVTVSNDEIVLRMKPREVKVFATDKKWETTGTTGRDYKGH